MEEVGGYRPDLALSRARTDAGSVESDAPLGNSTKAATE